MRPIHAHSYPQELLIKKGLTDSPFMIPTPSIFYSAPQTQCDIFPTKRLTQNLISLFEATHSSDNSIMR